jgi:hypothetical protein
VITSLSFLGGVGTVTGSKYAIEHDRHTLLVAPVIDHDGNF